jgi:threonine/homoserine/homoserine lactone efflux protein
MTLHGLITFALIYLVFVITPGPGIGAIVARGLGLGLRHAVPFLAGFVLGDIVWFTVAALGLAALSTQFSAAFVVLKYAGCAYLLYLAWKMWTTPVAASEVLASADATLAWSSFAGSFTLTLSNPKVIVFFLSLMPIVVQVQDMSIAIWFSMAAIMAMVCASSIGCYLVLAHQARRLFSSRRALQRINRSAAAMMAIAAGTIAVKG